MKSPEEIEDEIEREKLHSYAIGLRRAKERAGGLASEMVESVQKTDE